MRLSAARITAQENGGTLLVRNDSVQDREACFKRYSLQLRHVGNLLCPRFRRKTLKKGITHSLAPEYDSHVDMPRFIFDHLFSFGGTQLGRDDVRVKSDAPRLGQFHDRLIERLL
jgi:hypothetical protein